VDDALEEEGYAAARVTQCIVKIDTCAEFEPECSLREKR
jgi:hypothetical protein